MQVFLCVIVYMLCVRACVHACKCVCVCVCLCVFLHSSVWVPHRDVSLTSPSLPPLPPVSDQELSSDAGSFWLCLTGVKLSSDQSPALLH